MWYNKVMEEWKERTTQLLGEQAMTKLAAARVAVFGLGGVGGHAAEALLRAGVGALTLVDGDVFAVSNLNRQLFATADVMGQPKAEVAKARLLSIVPDADIVARAEFFLPDSDFDFSPFDYVVDAVDTVAAKMEIVTRCADLGVPVISSMGAGNKLDPTAFRVADIYETKVCPLARVIRRLCREKGIASLKVVYSEEEPAAASRVPASVSFVPSVCGLVIAGEVVRDLTNQDKRIKTSKPL